MNWATTLPMPELPGRLQVIDQKSLSGNGWPAVPPKSEASKVRVVVAPFAATLAGFLRQPWVRQVAGALVIGWGVAGEAGLLCPGVPAEVLDPRAAWADKAAYDAAAQALVARFEKNFAQFEGAVGGDVREVALKAAA